MSQETSKSAAIAAAERQADLRAVLATPGLTEYLAAQQAETLARSADLVQTQINAIMTKAADDTAKTIAAGLEAKIKAGLHAEFDKAATEDEVNVLKANGEKIRVPAKKIEPSWTDKGIYKWGALTLSALLGAGAGAGGTYYAMKDNEPSST